MAYKKYKKKLLRSPKFTENYPEKCELVTWCRNHVAARAYPPGAQKDLG